MFVTMKLTVQTWSAAKELTGQRPKRRESATREEQRCPSAAPLEDARGAGGSPLTMTPWNGFVRQMEGA